uniref:Si:dkey-4c23.5 n=1 Tax=Cyprinus carpio TaxID=7962 RepID=A0A8C2GDC3_CYPCA
MNSRLSLLILLLIIPDPATLDQLSVTCSHKSICAVKGSKVTLWCSYSSFKIKTVFWFSEKQSTNWRKNNEPEDLTLDSDYSGRVIHQISSSSSTLTISDVRERDSGEYQLMFIMNDGVKHLSSAAVNLTVTVLQVKMNPESTDMTDESVELNCDSSCTSGGSYYWMKNEQYFRYTESRNMFVSISQNAGKFSCFLHPDLKHRSSYLCVSQNGCWDVTYTSRRVCALVGSTVDISCTYSHPSGHTVNTTFWHYGQPRDFEDLREEHQFAGRVEYEGNKLRIKELKSRDSGEYRFRFITNLDQYSGSPGVILTVTDTQVTSSPATVSGGEKVILSCLTKCTLNNKYTYIWYKNGQQVTDGLTKDNKLYLDSVSNEELQQYSCAAEDQKESTALRNAAVILCVFFTLALIGILWYRRRMCTLSKTHRIEKGEEEVQYDSVHNNTAPSDFTQKSDADNQDIQYSSISFKTKHTSSVPTDEYPTDATETEAVHYATVRFK